MSVKAVGTDRGNVGEKACSGTHLNENHLHYTLQKAKVDYSKAAFDRPFSCIWEMRPYNGLQQAVPYLTAEAFMSRSVRDNPISFPFPVRADFTIDEAKTRIAMSLSIVAAGDPQPDAGDGSRADVAPIHAGSFIDINKLDQLTANPIHG